MFYSVDKSKPKPIENIIFEPGQVIEEQSFEHSIIKFIGASKIKFIKCNFSYARFSDVYLEGCEFENCQFIGAKFADSNLRDTVFSNCIFNYCEFKNTEVSWEILLGNLPAFPNVRERFLRILRKNFEGLGDRKILKPILFEEIKSSDQYYKEAIKQKHNYYKNKYDTPKKLRLLKWDHFTQQVSWYVWGHGEYPSRIMYSATTLLVLVYALLIVLNLNRMNLMSCSYFFSDLYELSWKELSLFIGISENSENFYVPNALKLTLLVSRYVTLSLLFSTAVRRHSWR